MLQKLSIKKKLKSTDELLREETGDIRSLRPFENIIVAIIGISWALYQLALPSILISEAGANIRQGGR